MNESKLDHENKLDIEEEIPDEERIHKIENLLQTLKAISDGKEEDQSDSE